MERVLTKRFQVTRAIGCDPVPRVEIASANQEVRRSPPRGVPDLRLHGDALMGMYDTISVRYPLPVDPPLPIGEKFQTKDLGCDLDEYDLTEDGELHLDGSLCSFTGVVRFYAMLDGRGWVEFEAHFQGGWLTRAITRVPNRECEQCGRFVRGGVRLCLRCTNERREMRKSTYYCDVCTNPIDSPHRVYYHGAAITARGVERRFTDDTVAKVHLCYRCLSMIQWATRVCGSGYECEGGPRCASDHK